MTKAYFSRRILNKTLSGLLAFWLSGLVFLFCCETPKAQAGGGEAAASRPPAETNHCNKRKPDESARQFASFRIQCRALGCWVLPSIFDAARKLEPVPQASEAAAAVKVSPPKFSIDESSFEAPSLYRPPVLNRGGTYLKNRILRI